MSTIYYIPQLDETVLMVGITIENNALTIELHANLEIKKEIEKLTYDDMVYIGEL